MRANYQKLSHSTVLALIAFDKTLVNSGIESTTIDLVKIRASQLNGCLFCLDMHSKEATAHGERELRLYHLALWHESSLFTERERGALLWAEMLTQLDHQGISDDDYAEVAAVFTEKELCDLTLIVTSINTWNRLGIAFRPEPGSLDRLLGLDKVGLQ